MSAELGGAVARDGGGECIGAGKREGGGVERNAPLFLARGRSAGPLSPDLGPTPALSSEEEASPLRPAAARARSPPPLSPLFTHATRTNVGALRRARVDRDDDAAREYEAQGGRPVVGLDVGDDLPLKGVQLCEEERGRGGGGRAARGVSVSRRSVDRQCPSKRESACVGRVQGRPPPGSADPATRGWQCVLDPPLRCIKSQNNSRPAPPAAGTRPARPRSRPRPRPRRARARPRPPHRRREPRPEREGPDRTDPASGVRGWGECVRA